ncbi:hypothetical protein AK812_SmicGene48841, partial [Symbiodinium microadriaticum]
KSTPRPPSLPRHLAGSRGLPRPPRSRPKRPAKACWA